jgi:hypothetical protein
MPCGSLVICRALSCDLARGAHLPERQWGTVGAQQMPPDPFPYEQLVEGNGRRSLDQLADRNDVRW